jgi:glycosyltransferase involved in cell wall biosynthesis
LFVGGLDKPHYFKGVPKLLLAMTASALKDARLIIVGDGCLRPGFEAYARKIGVSGRTIFAGSVAEEELPAYYRLADAFAFPSLDRSEAFGIAALEALASGVPVVASDLPGVRTIVRDGETGRLAVPGSASSLAAGLGEILADEALRHRLGAAGRAMVERHYAEESGRERWKRLLESLP